MKFRGRGEERATGLPVDQVIADLCNLRETSDQIQIQLRELRSLMAGNLSEMVGLLREMRDLLRALNDQTRSGIQEAYNVRREMVQTQARTEKLQRIMKTTARLELWLAQQNDARARGLPPPPEPPPAPDEEPLVRPGGGPGPGPGRTL